MTQGATVGGRRAVVRWGADRLLDAEGAARTRLLDRLAAQDPPRQRVLVLGVERPRRLMPELRAELERSRHDVAVVTRVLDPASEAPPKGKFENLNDLLAEHPAGDYDWLLITDDDIMLPRGFLDRFVLCLHAAGLALAQPAHRLHSHAAWPVTRRRPRAAVRQTNAVEIGPLTAFSRAAFAAFLPFPPLRMGWGLDRHWGAVARERGLRVGIVDATPIMHVDPVGATYDTAAAQAESDAFLATRPHIATGEQQWSRRIF